MNTSDAIIDIAFVGIACLVSILALILAYPIVLAFLVLCVVVCALVVVVQGIRRVAVKVASLL